MRIAAALLAVALAASFATVHAVMLVLLVAWHAALIAMPMAAVVLGCLHAGLRDTTVLALLGLSGGGLAAFALFWVWWASPTAGALASIAVIAASAAAIAWLGARLDRRTLRHANPLGVAALVWIAYALFVLAFGLAPSGFQSPLGAVQHRFTHWLPNDNVLPWAFAQQIAADRVTIPMTDTWLSSDRPPQQTAYFLASVASLLPRSELHYQVQSTLLQSLWVPGMWVLLKSFGLARGAIFLALAAGMFSGFAFTNGLYTWPKLFPVAYIAVAAAVVLNATRETLSDPRIGAAVGACIALAMLCHASTIFVLVGLGAALVALRRIPPMRFLAVAAATAFAIALPWILYQTFVDPPGDRLLKWHLAGVTQVDSRSFAETVHDAYAAVTLEELVQNRYANLKSLVGPPGFPQLVWYASTVGLNDQDVVALRTWQFFHIVSALGVLALAPLAWLMPRAWRKREFASSLLLFAVCLLTVVPWVLLIFVPGGTLIHTGSLAVVCFLFSAAMLAFFAASPWLALAALALHVGLTLDVYARAVPLADGASIADYRAFGALALMALAITCGLLWKLSAMSDENLVERQP